MSIPYRGWTSHDTYFITASCMDKKPLLQSGQIAGLFVMSFITSARGKYLLHEFVVMPNRFHLLLTPGVTLGARSAIG